MLDRALDALARAGVSLAVVNVHHLAPQIEARLASRARPAIRISREDELLETGGGIAKAISHFGAEPFFAVNADIVWMDGKTPALARLAKTWNGDRMDALLLVQPVERAVGYDGAGDFALTRDGRLERRGAAPSAPFVFAGVQILHPRLFADAPHGAFSLNLLYDRAHGAGRLFGLAHDGGWLHVGTMDGLAAAERALAGPSG
jgi:MurNAc alpha-1-phosphate uridylyltransferase